jgi:hypothetical protein
LSVLEYHVLPLFTSINPSEKLAAIYTGLVGNAVDDMKWTRKRIVGGKRVKTE